MPETSNIPQKPRTAQAKTAHVGALSVTPKGMRRVRNGHPWIFANDLVRGAQPATPGVVAVSDPGGMFVGQALFNPRSKIALRLVTHTSAPVTADLFAERARVAVRYRERVASGFEAFRVVHSEADGLPGLTVDKYADILVVQQHAAALEPFMPAILDVLTRAYRPSGILARNDHAVRALEGLPQTTEVLTGSVPDEVAFTEGEVTLFAAPYSGQKTGAFLDQRENHVYAGTLARGRALDVFSYHGGFALALARHAESVVALDSSAPALEHVAQAAAHNGLSNVTTLRGDAFEHLRAFNAAGETFDTIVLDPPAFAKGRGHLERALAGYKDINLQALKLLAPGGRLVTASCSYHLSDADFYAILQDAAGDASRQVRVLARRTQAPCHPELLGLPETHYLKLAALEVV
ncbi:class I SAM-dependent rRNA methyltransferase [soil metagenome]